MHKDALASDLVNLSLYLSAFSIQYITDDHAMAQGISLRRMIDAEEIAHVVAFLASPKSVAINGDAVAVAGGSGRAIHY